MLDDVIAANDENEPRLRRKAVYFTCGWYVLGTGLTAALILAFFD
jgi:hypothetical protein